MESRLGLDVETEIPLGRLCPAAWNPKAPISGPYRRGLENSLDYFGLRDRLHVWPADDKTSYFYVLDGNQRLTACEDMILDSLIREHFKLDDGTPLARIAAMREDPSNAKVIARLRSRAVKSPVPVQIIDKLDANTPFTRIHAKLFTSIWNRNHAKYDEIKQADLFREIRESLASALEVGGEKRRALIDSRLKSMMRPEVPHAPVPASGAGPASGAAAPPTPVPQFAAPGSFTPTAEEPWGPPPQAPAGLQSQNQANVSVIPDARPKVVAFIPMVFSLTESAYNAVSDSVLRSKSRVFRETRLVDALGRLERLYDGSDLEKIAESAIVEIALTIFNHRFEAANEQSVHP